MYQLQSFPELDSTNTYAHAHLGELADRTVIVAERQTAGRGQQGKRWLSNNTENIYLSIVLKPAVSPDSPLLVNLSQITGRIIADVLRNFCPEASVTVKLPNDILINGEKVCGILTETVVRGQTLIGAIIGVGLNVQLTAAERASIDQPATALADCNPDVSKVQVLEAVLAAFFAAYDQLSPQ